MMNIWLMAPAIDVARTIRRSCATEEARKCERVAARWAMWAKRMGMKDIED